MADPSFRAEKAMMRRSIEDSFHVLGKVNEGTFGVVYKAVKAEDKEKYERFKHNAAELSKMTFLAIKKPKNSREGEGFNKDAVREIALLKELSRHQNIVTLRDVVLCPEGSAATKGLYLVFDWAEFELCEILKNHRDKGMKPPGERMVKSIMWQILNGISYIHHNWIIHRDLKPSNILIMGKGQEYGRVKIADFGMARLIQQPLRALHLDGVVVTVWYRAPELLMGAKHYSKAIDMWALGCIFCELMTNTPVFQGKEDKQPKALQEDQIRKIFRVIGKPTAQDWQQITELPEWNKIAALNIPAEKNSSIENSVPALRQNPHALDLVKRFFDYDPKRRISAQDAMCHSYFTSSQFPFDNVFQGEPGSPATEIAAYGPRSLTAIGMNGQAMQLNPPQAIQPPHLANRPSLPYAQAAGQKRAYSQMNMMPNKMQRK